MQSTGTDSLDIEATYELRERAATEDYARWSRQQSIWGSALALVAVLAGTLAWRAFHEGASGRPVGFCVLTALLLTPVMLRARARASRAARRAMFYREAIERASGAKPQTGRTGEAFAEAGHLYARDLEVLGPDSLFGMLATTRTALGERALAGLLLHGISGNAAARTGLNAAAVRQRQTAVRELTPLLDLREAVALLGRSKFEELPAESFDGWLSLESAELPRWLRPALLLTTLAWIAVLLMGLLRHWPGDLLWRNLCLLWGAQMLVSWRFRAAVLRELEVAKRLAAPLGILREGMLLLGRQRFTAPLLTGFVAAAGAETMRPLRSLERALLLAEQREVGWMFALGLFFAMGTQTAISLSRWRTLRSGALRGQIEAWAEFEALLALATYAAEHGANAYPEIVGEGETVPAATFEAESLRHPLLPAGVAVPNDIALRGSGAAIEETVPAAAFLLISGSNMAGKSTLLRAVGLTAVLGMAGAPVPAGRVRMSALRIGTSLAIGDSLAEGRSKFLAEVERLRAIAELARESQGTALFLIDEILSGTNSADRRMAAEAVVRGLVGTGAIGALSTHDLTLAEIAEAQGLRGRNVHMASPDPEDPLRFDYKLKDGMNRTTNAMAIVRMLGLLG